jgi:flagellar biogenesis protein FliO
LWDRIEGLWERLQRAGRRAPKILRLSESLPLGERRFVAVVEVGRERFLVGGTASTLVLLSRLPAMGEAMGVRPADAGDGEVRAMDGRSGRAC